MNVIRHDHIATYCGVGGFSCAFAKKNERSVNLILCKEPMSLVCAERDEVERTRCEEPIKTWWSPPESRLHGKSYSTLNRTIPAVAMALWAVIQSRLGPATGQWLHFNPRS